MNLKKTWNKKYGKSEIVTKENSPCKNVEIDKVKKTKGWRLFIMGTEDIFLWRAAAREDFLPIFRESGVRSWSLPGIPNIPSISTQK